MNHILASNAGLPLVATGCNGSIRGFTEPTTGTALGGPNNTKGNHGPRRARVVRFPISPQLVQIDGPDPITVRFPSGRVVEFEDFDVAALADDNTLTGFLDL